MSQQTQKNPTTTKHWKKYVDFCKVHPEILTGTSSNSDCLWGALAAELNAIGKCQKSVVEWKKALDGFKQRTIKRVEDNLDEHEEQFMVLMANAKNHTMNNQFELILQSSSNIEKRLEKIENEVINLNKKIPNSKGESSSSFLKRKRDEPENEKNEKQGKFSNRKLETIVDIRNELAKLEDKTRHLLRP